MVNDDDFEEMETADLLDNSLISDYFLKLRLCCEMCAIAHAHVHTHR